MTDEQIMALWNECRVNGDFTVSAAALAFARALLATPTPISDEPVANLAVWYGSMPESNGKSNWTAILHNGDISRGITLDRSEYPDRVRYEADRVRWLIGELDKEPWILDYDADKHSGYAAPLATPSDKQEAVADNSQIVTRLRRALYQIAHWPDGGNAYGQDKIKRFAAGILDGDPPAPLAQSAEQDRIDAERYRFLRDKMRFSSPPGDIPTMTLSAPLEAPTHDTHKDWISDRFDASVDRTIDAAISKERAND